MTALERTPKQDRSRATRARLLESAVDALAELGYSASTVAVVAERAGVSRGAAQHHFPTREDLFAAALEHMTDVRADELRREIGRLPGRPSTAQIVELTLAMFSGPLFRAALTLWVAAASDPALHERVVPLEARIGRQIQRVVVDLLDVDPSAPGVRETVQATLELGRGLGVATLFTADTRRRRRIATQWAAMLDAQLT